MISFVLGTANSGKSELAEKLAVEAGGVRYYIATMKVCDEAGRERVIRHRKQREGKGFITLEQERNITAVLKQVKDPLSATFLLECVSNLVGNEIYDDPVTAEGLRSGTLSEDSCAERIAEEIKKLSEAAANLIIVSNEYESDGAGYDEQTRRYVRLLILVNKRIEKFSDRIYDLRKGR